MSPILLRALALGHPCTLADALYLQAISLWGLKTVSPEKFVDLGPLLQRVVALDPYYEAAYLLGGTALTLSGMDTASGMALLRDGTRKLPNSWRLLLLYGFNALDLQDDAATAARALAAAARLPDAPPYLPMLAATVSAKSHNYALGIALLQALANASQDADERARYLLRIEELRALQKEKA